MEEAKFPLVSVQCAVYNHAPYLRQCLDGFVMQKTNFAFEAIVHDDASTDGSAAIIREYAEKYPNIIKPIYETENQYSKQDGSLTDIMNKAIHSDVKYIAICEGDDYWTDPYKLQKQVDFLEHFGEYGLIYGKAKVYDQVKQSFVGFTGKRFFGKDELILTNTIPTLTVLLRKDLFFRYFEEVKPNQKRWNMGDFPMWIWFSINSKVQYLDEVLGVYRVLPESASHFSDLNKALAMSVSSLNIKQYFINCYWLDNKQLMLDKVERYFYMRGRMLIAKVGDASLNRKCFEFFISRQIYFSAIITKILYLFRKSDIVLRLIVKFESFFVKKDYKY